MKLKNVLFSIFISGMIFSGSVFGQEKTDSLKKEIAKQQKEVNETKKNLNDQKNEMRN